MFDIKAWIARRRYGGITGLSMMDANVKMLLVGTAPLLVLVVFNSVFLPAEYQAFQTWITMGGLVMEVFWIGTLYMRAKSDANGLIVFPQTHMRFPDGTSRWYDLKVAPDGIEEICTYPDGSRGYHLKFLERYEHQDKKMNFPYVWQGMYWHVPTTWSDAFERLSHGEIFHQNVFVDHGSCEPLTLYVKDFPETEDGFEPLCGVADSSFQYKQWLHNGEEKKLARPDLYLMPFRKAQKKVGDLLAHTVTLETALEVERDARGKGFKKELDKSLETILDSVHIITEAKTPLLSRIFNFKTIAKALIIFGGILLISHFLLGFP